MKSIQGTAHTQPSSKSRWGRQRRLEFIDFRSFWEGRINRRELVDFFGTSVQQASLDLKHYLKAAPRNLRYDRTDKTYRATSRFRPAFARIDSQLYLNQMSALAAGTLPRSASFLGWSPPSDTVTFPTRAVRPAVLATLVQAIRDKNELEVSYSSMRADSPERRWIAPHALAFDGARWHTRAWCHHNGDFRDFVLSRIRLVRAARRAAIDPNADARWNTFVTIVLKPRKQLPGRQRTAVETEFAMTGGALRVEVREALVFYYIRHLQLDGQRDEIRTHPIEWVNRHELSHLVDEAARR